jgi:hypothetical protein
MKGKKISTPRFIYLNNYKLLELLLSTKSNSLYITFNVYLIYILRHIFSKNKKIID